MDKSSFAYLLEFLNSEKQHVVKFDDMENEESLSDIDESENEEEDA